VAEINEMMTIDELREWQAFDRVSPIGAYRQDVQAAMIALSNSGGKESTLSDFILFDRTPMTAKQKAVIDKRNATARSEAYVQNLVSTLQSRVKTK